VALLAESLVEERLNRQNFFTIRGVKHGIDEIDLLELDPKASGADASAVIHRLRDGLEALIRDVDASA
jgi:hypothetical protein